LIPAIRTMAGDLPVRPAPVRLALVGRVGGLQYQSRPLARLTLVRLAVPVATQPAGSAHQPA
jgi:hypothetical protein